MAKTPIRKTGLPPGSLIYTGIQKSDEIITEFVRYNSDTIEQIDPDQHRELQPGFFYWMDVRGIHNPAVIEAIGKRFSLNRCYWKIYSIRNNARSMRILTIPFSSS
jgi:magnesium transporter